MDSTKNFVRYTIASFFIPFDFISRDLVVSIVYDYYFTEKDCMNLSFFSEKYKQRELFQLPSLFFTKISVLKVGTPSHELRDLLPSICFRIVPFCQIYCHRWDSLGGTFRYCDSLVKFSKICECKRSQRNRKNKKIQPNKIIGGKFEILKHYKRYVLDVKTKNDELKLKSYDMSYQKNNIKKRQTIMWRTAEKEFFLNMVLKIDSYIPGMWYMANSHFIQNLNLLLSIFEE